MQGPQDLYLCHILSSVTNANAAPPSPRGCCPKRMDDDGFSRRVRDCNTGKSRHQSAQTSVHGPGCGMCQEAYAPWHQCAVDCTQRCSLKEIVSRVAGSVYVTCMHHCSVVSTSHGVRLIMRGTAECNARKTAEREYPDKHAICAHVVLLSRQEIHVCRNGSTLSTTPTMMLDTRLLWHLGLQRRSTRTLHRTWGSSTMYHQDRRCRR